MAQADQEFERLKQKYQPAFNLVAELRGQVQHVSMKGTKLLIRGMAPSAKVKNRIWDQIKLIDSTLSDLVLDIIVSQQRASPASVAMTAGGSVGGTQNQRRYIVKPGDNLFKISRACYGDGNRYTKIFNANRNILRDLNTMNPGQELMIPK
jgi:nucleoid-associated protein YgaU